MSNFTVGENWSNDPCPDGWRVPTKNELQSLEKSLNTQDLEDNEGQKGWWYGSTATENRIFFQAAGFRDGMSGVGVYRGEYGFYWSSTYDGGFWMFKSHNGGLDKYPYTTAFPVRCVKNVD